ncbi:MAG: DUF4105 domain-containing protein [Gemmatimonadota bacterium]|jgi:hypothetical protein
MRLARAPRRTTPARPRGIVARTVLFAAALAALHSAPASPRGPARQAPEQDSTQSSLSSASLRVYLMTMGQGDAVWEKFGHNAIWIRDEQRGLDVAYNWGVFDFDQPGFYTKLMRGRMQYRLAAYDGVRMANAYADANRTIWLQELNLTPGQKLELLRFVEWNNQPENREYRYDYYRDNCSTRVRDALNRVMGGDLQRQLEAMPTQSTYRTETQRLTAAEIPAWTGLLLAMGHPVDRTLDAWEDAFIPMRLMESIKSVTVPGPTGPEPLVLSDAVVFRADRAPERETAPDRRLSYTLAGVAFGALLLGLARLGRKARAARAGFFTLATVWSLAAGVFGTMIAMLWAFTEHTATYANENVLQVEPLSLLLAGLLVAAAFGRGMRKARLLAFVIAAIAVTGFVMQVLPGFDQVNGAIVGLVAPVHLCLAASLASLGRSPASSRSDR